MKLETTRNLICLEWRTMERGLPRGKSCKKKKKKKESFWWYSKEFALTPKKSLDQRRDEVRSVL